MLNVLVHPSILSCPDPDNGKALSLLDLSLHVAELYDLIDNHRGSLKLFLSRKGTANAQLQSRYLADQALNDKYKKVFENDPNVSLNAIAQLIRDLVQKHAHYLEDDFPIDDLNYSDYFSKPALSDLYDCCEFTNLAEYLTLYLSFLKIDLPEESAINLIFGISNKLGKDCYEVDFKANKAKGTFKAPLKPRLNTISPLGKATIVTCSRELCRRLDPVEMWSNAKNNDDLVKSIELFVKRNPSSITKRWSIGHRFFESLLDIQPTKIQQFAKQALESCYFAINQAPKAHKLKPGGGQDKIRKIDKAIAWRNNVSGKLRLHYWNLPDGGIEFANINEDHDNFSIIE
jgi:hypothetical protein